MRRTSFADRRPFRLQVPRGWIIVGAALIGWAVVAGIWAGVSQLVWLVTGAH